MKKVTAIYHKDCIDGTAAAAVVLRKFPHAVLFPLKHAYTPEEIEPVLAMVDANTEVYTVDCGLGIKELLAKGFTVTTLDHHIGAKELFESLAKENHSFTFVFDNERSGASLAWSFFFPDENEPELIKYVEDADLWKWEYGNDTKNVNNYLSMFRNDPKYFLDLLEENLDEVKIKGAVISMYADKEIEEQVSLPSVNLKIGEHTIPAYNITVHESASGNILAERSGKAVAMFTVKGETVKLSFRSREHQSPTALELAHTLEGGGHEHASGADIPLNTFLKMLIPNP